MDLEEAARMNLLQYQDSTGQQGTRLHPFHGQVRGLTETIYDANIYELRQMNLAHAHAVVTRHLLRPPPPKGLGTRLHSGMHYLTVSEIS